MAILKEEDFKKFNDGVNKMKKELPKVTEVLQAEFNKIRGRETELHVYASPEYFTAYEVTGKGPATEYRVYPVWDITGEALVGIKLPADADEEDYILPIDSELPEVPENFVEKNFEILLKQHRKELDEAYFIVDQGKTLTINVRNMFGRSYAESDLEVLARAMCEDNVIAKVTSDGNIRLIPVDEKPLLEE